MLVGRLIWGRCSRFPTVSRGGCMNRGAINWRKPRRGIRLPEQLKIAQYTSEPCGHSPISSSETKSPTKARPEMRANCSECERLHVDRDAAIMDYIRVHSQLQNAQTEVDWKRAAELQRKLQTAQGILAVQERSIRRHWARSHRHEEAMPAWR